MKLILLFRTIEVSNTHALRGILLSILSFIFLLAGGFVAGTFGALLGLGGGVLLIPFLVMVLNVPMHQAIATSIIAVIATSSAGAAMNLERRIVHMRLGMLLEIATVSGAILGGITANYLSATVLAKLFSGLMFLVAIIMIWQIRQHNGQEKFYTDGVLPGDYIDDANGTTICYTVKKVPTAMMISLIAGNVSGMLGVGGGIFKVPAMHILSGIPMKAATATSNFMIGVTAAASAFIYFAHGHLNPFIASTAALGVLVGSMTGVRISRKIHSKVLTWVFAIALLGISIQLYLR
ncbi:MAG: sulfite exporter TauE/SafE family protein [Bacteroidota bacterium]